MVVGNLHEDLQGALQRYEKYPVAHSCNLRTRPSTVQDEVPDSWNGIGSLLPSHIAGCSDPTSGRKAKGTAAMHYYNQMPKRGKVAGGTNHPAYEAFLVNPRWIAGYVQRNKMTPEEAKQDFFFFYF